MASAHSERLHHKNQAQSTCNQHKSAPPRAVGNPRVAVVDRGLMVPPCARAGASAACRGGRVSGPWWAVVGPVLSRIGPVVVRRAGPLLARVNALPREPQAPTDASDAEMDRRERDMPAES